MTQRSVPPTPFSMPRLWKHAVLLAVLGMSFPTWAGAATGDPGITPRETSEYGKAFGVSKAEAERNLETQRRGIGIGDELEARLGPDYAGAWFDNEAGEFVVPVLGSGSRGQANLTESRAELSGQGLAGEYRTKPAQYSWDALEAAQRQIDAQLPGPTEPGQVRTALDAAANAVVIEFSGQTSAREEAALRSLANKAPVDVELRKGPRESFDAAVGSCNATTLNCGAPLRGGVKLNIHNGPAVCTIGFRARGFNSKWYALTAGHCMGKWWEPTIHWSAHDESGGQHYIGQLEQFQFPGHDWAKINATGSDWDTPEWPSKVVKWKEWAYMPGLVNEFYPVNAEANPYQGQFVYHSGITSGTSGGTVKTTNQTLTEVGTPYGLVTMTNMAGVEGGCNEGGDSGGPVFASSTGLGFLSVGENAGLPCFYSYWWFSKLPEATADLGVTVVGGPPGASTGIADNIQPYQAHLHGQVQPNSWDTDFRFEWGKTCYCQSSSEGSAGSGTSWVAKSKNALDLDPNRKYKYRIRAKSALGTTYGEDKYFETPPAPPKPVAEENETAATIRVEEEDGKATLKGRINPGGADTDYRFEWGTEASGEFPSSAPVPDGDAGDGIANTYVETPIGGLKGSTKYHFRLRAENEVDAVTSSVKYFETPDWHPVVSDESDWGPYVEEETGKTKLKGKVNPKGFATEYHFEWGTQTEFEAEEFNNASPDVEIGNGQEDIEVEQTIEGLKGLTTYHYRLVATNVEGTAQTEEDKSFETPDWRPKVYPTAAIDVERTDATLSTRINSQGFATKYRFEWATQAEFEAAEYGHVVPAEYVEIGNGQEFIELTEPLEGLKERKTYHVRVVAENVEGNRTSGDDPFTTSSSAFEHESANEIARLEGTPVPGSFSLYVASGEHSCEGPEFEATVEGLVVESALTSSVEGMTCYTDETNVPVEMNGCQFELDPDYGKEGSYEAEINIGPPGCGPIEWTRMAPYCEISIPDQIGRTAELTSKGEDSGEYLEVDLKVTELRYTGEAGLCSGASGPNANGALLGTWKVEAKELYGEEQVGQQVGLRVDPLVEASLDVVTEPAINVSGASANVRGTINTEGAEVDYKFQYGTTTEYGNWTGEETIEAGAEAPVTVGQTITDLQPETTYHYRLKASADGYSSSWGEDGTFTTTELRPPSFVADEYPAEISLVRDSAEEPVFATYNGEGAELVCFETAELAGDLEDTASTLGVEAEYGGCTFMGEQASVQMNSCRWLYGVDNAGLPFTGTFGIACDEEGDQVEVDAMSSLGIRLKIAPQSPASVVAYESQGEGSSATLHAEAAAEGIEFSCEGSNFICKLAGSPEGTSGTGEVGFEDGLTLEGQNEAEEAIGVSVIRGDPVGMYVSGEESEEEAAQPRFDAEELPADIGAERDSASEPLLTTAGGGQELLCGASQMASDLDDAGSALAFDAEYGGCTFMGDQASVQMNSCRWLYGVDNVGPSYVGTVGVACDEEDEIAVDVPSLGIALKIASQSPEGEVAYEGEGSSATVHADAVAEGIEFSCEGSNFICKLAGSPEGTSGTGEAGFEEGLTLSGFYR